MPINSFKVLYSFHLFYAKRWFFISLLNMIMSDPWCSQIPTYIIHVFPNIAITLNLYWKYITEEILEYQYISRAIFISFHILSPKCFFFLHTCRAVWENGLQLPDHHAKPDHHVEWWSCTQTNWAVLFCSHTHTHARAHTHTNVAMRPLLVGRCN